MGKHRQERTRRGDRQAGEITRKTKVVESGADYQKHARGGDLSYPESAATHHINGLADQEAIVETLDEKGLKRYRDFLKSGNVYIGNQSLNYTGVFDGALSSKAVPKRGIYSYDHKDVHELTDKKFKDIGYDTKKKTYKGIPISELPENLKQALGLQIGWLSQEAVDEVQGTRSRLMREAFPNETYQQRKTRILENPNSYASIDSKGRPIPDSAKPHVTNKPPVPKKPPNRKALKALAAAGVAAPTVLGTAASAAETTGRAQLASQTGNPVDWIQTAISGVSGLADLVPGIGEFISTPADIANMTIDGHREPKTVQSQVQALHNLLTIK